MHKGLRQIPGVGKKIEKYLMNLGYVKLEDLKGQDPEEMYERDCILKGFKEDRCLLYVYRVAVYFAENEVHEVEKLKWWNWKD